MGKYAGLSTLERESKQVDELAAYIHAQPYDRWHWAVETYGRADLLVILRENGGVKRAKAAIRGWVDLMNERQREVAFE